jgi:hypothetical protein
MMMLWHGIEGRIHDDGAFTCPIDGHGRDLGGGVQTDG